MVTGKKNNVQKKKKLYFKKDSFLIVLPALLGKMMTNYI